MEEDAVREPDAMRGVKAPALGLPIGSEGASQYFWTAGSHRLVSYRPDFLLGPDES